MEKMNVEIIEYALSPDWIIFSEKASKNAVLKELAEKLGEAPQVKDPHELLEKILKDGFPQSARDGAALTYISLNSVSDIVMSAAICKAGIKDWAGAGEPVRIAVMIASSKLQSQQQDSLKAIEYFNELFKDKALFSKLLVSKDKTEAYNVITDQITDQITDAL